MSFNPFLTTAVHVILRSDTCIYDAQVQVSDEESRFVTKNGMPRSLLSMTVETLAAQAQASGRSRRRARGSTSGYPNPHGGAGAGGAGLHKAKRAKKPASLS